MYKRNGYKWLKHVDFLILDILSLALSYFVSYALYFRCFTIWNMRMYAESFILYLLIDATVTFFTELFRNVLKRDHRKEFILTLQHVIFVSLLHTLWLVMTKQSQRYSRFIIISTGVLYFFTSYITRNLWKKRVMSGRRFKQTRKIMIVTTKASAEEDIENIRSMTYGAYDIDGICLLDEDVPQENICGISNIIKSDDVLNYVSSHWIDEVYFGEYLESADCHQILKGLSDAGLTIHIALKHMDALKGTKQFVEKVGKEYTLTSAMATLHNGQLFAKRLLDILGGLVGSLITLLLMLIIGPLIKKADPGPILYTSTRVGENGKTFKMYKFRSMIMGADKMKEELMAKEGSDGLMFKMDHDPRIIGGKNGIGEFIRKTSLDEFPQFFNVLIGQMSLVGTRPPTPDEWAKYQPHHRARLSAKPGVTGLWQISGRSDIKDFEEVVKLDKEYITNWSLWGDIKIILKTIPVVLGKKGSY